MSVVDAVTMMSNPYEPPPATEPNDSWLAKFCRLFSRPAASREIPFEDGGKLITDGIAFYLDRSDATRLFAASPSAVHTDQRLNLVISQVLLVFPLFLKDNPKFEPLVRGRKICVRLIDTYADAPTEFVREYALEWDYVAGVLNDADEG